MEIPLEISFIQRTVGDKEIAALEVISQVVEYYKLNNVEKERVFTYFLNRTICANTDDKQNN